MFNHIAPLPIRQSIGNNLYMLFRSLFIPSLSAILLAACSYEEPPADLADYQLWQARQENASAARQLSRYLKEQGVDQIIPIHQLLRSDVAWKKCGADAFEVPPKEYWPHIVPALRLLRDQVIPRMGQVEILSAYRSPKMNSCIRGAKQSFHLKFHAMDMRPAKPIGRAALIRTLCSLHKEKGAAYNMGLGIYKGTRFHIDAAGYRRWGYDYRSESSPCNAPL